MIGTGKQVDETSGRWMKNGRSGANKGKNMAWEK